MSFDQIQTADQFFEQFRNSKPISTSCPILDEVLKGGVRRGTITEITGEAGTGKTQFSLQLLMESLLSEDGKDVDGKAIYVTTQKPVNEKRLEELKYGFLCRRFGMLGPEEVARIDEKVNNSLIFHKAITLPEFLAIFHSNFIPLEFRPLRMLVIDSIASITMECQDFHSKNHFLKKTANNLKSFAQKHDAAIICVNQVVSKPDPNSSSTKFTSALGPLWSIQVTERFFLERKRQNDTRALKVKISPRLPRKRVPFVIQSNGLTGNLDVIREIEEKASPIDQEKNEI